MVGVRSMAEVLPGWIGLSLALRGGLGLFDLKLGGQRLVDQVIQDVRERQLIEVPVKQGFYD